MKNIQVLNRWSIYWCRYMHTVETEYWSGFNRIKVFTLGRFTFWKRIKEGK